MTPSDHVHMLDCIAKLRQQNAASERHIADLLREIVALRERIKAIELKTAPVVNIGGGA